MKLSQKNIFQIILVAIIALYNFILFVATSNVEKTEVFWIAYGFIMFAPLLLLTLTILPLKFTGGTNLVLSLPIYRVIFTYFGIEFFVGTLFMFLQNKASVKVALLVQVPILIICAIVFFVFLLGAKHVSENYAQQKREVFALNMLQMRVNMVVGSIGSTKVDNKLKAIAEKIKYSDFHSYPENREIEEEMSITISSLEDAVTEDVAMAQAEKLERLIAKRNAMCQYIKKMRG